MTFLRLFRSWRNDIQWLYFAFRQHFCYTLIAVQAYVKIEIDAIMADSDAAKISLLPWRHLMQI